MKRILPFLICLLIGAGGMLFWQSYEKKQIQQIITASKEKIGDLERDNKETKTHVKQLLYEANKNAILEQQDKEKIQQLSIIIEDKTLAYNELKKQSIQKPVVGKTYSFEEYAACVNVVNKCEEISADKDKNISIMEHTIVLLEKDRVLLMEGLEEQSKIIDTKDLIIAEKDTIINALMKKENPNFLVVFLDKPYIKYPAMIGLGIWTGYKIGSNNKTIIVN